MVLADLEAVCAVEVGAYAWPWSRGNFVDTLAAGHWAQVLAGDDGAVRGYVVAMAGVGEMHLLNVTVAPTLQGRGLGRRLLSALHAEARARHAAEVWLEVRASNRRAQQLYEQLGYVQVGVRRQYYPGPPGRREDAVLMSLRLAEAPASSVAPVDQVDRVGVPQAAGRSELSHGG
jgi:ribosomal-protein-alanine N-acetyltransferase